MIVRERKYNADGTRVDRNQKTRLIIGVDGEGWNLPLTDGVKCSNPHVTDLILDPETGELKERGWHSYVLLVAADDKGHKQVLTHDGSRREATETTARNYGLPTIRQIEFLLSLPEDALVVGFYFNYDTTKIFADLPISNLEELAYEGIIPQDEYSRRVRDISRRYGFTTDYVHKTQMVSQSSTVYNGYLINYTQRKFLEITDLRAGQETVRDKFKDKNGQWRLGKPETKWARKVTVWDTYSFFQKSFVKALTDYRCGYCEACKSKPQKFCITALWKLEDLKRIEQMKLHRGAFDPSELDSITEYCIDECRYLSFLVRDLLVGIDSFGLKLKSYHGSGSVASAWMTQNEIKKSLPNRIIDNIDANGVPHFNLSGLPEEIALSGYYGGRFEISEIGYVGDLYSYDINSAYPAVTVDLPCLAHGRFERVSEAVTGPVGIYLVGSHTSGPYAPFPFRTEVPDSDSEAKAKDAIYYGHGGKRWVWNKELEIARKHFGIDAIPVYDGRIWIPAGCDCKPFGSIPEMYKLRQQYVIDGNGIEKVIKLILNSLYGKTAQSLGWNIDKNGNKLPPPFQCFVWAGIITSGCRAMILDAIMQSDADVVSIATDGILSRTPITGIDAPKEKVLGKWEASKVDEGYLFQSGVYTMLTSKGRKYATRGFSAREVTAEELIAAYMNGDSKVSANPTESRFVNMKAIKTRTGALDYIGQWIPSEHDITFTHNRRLPLPDDPMNFDPLEFMPKSWPVQISEDLISAPYSPKQSWESVMENQPVSDEIDHFEVNK